MVTIAETLRLGAPPCARRGSSTPASVVQRIARCRTRGRVALVVGEQSLGDGTERGVVS